MIIRKFARRPAIRTVGFGAVALGVYTLMIWGTLAHLEDLSGHVPFDMRPMGYDWAAAHQILTALDDEGRDYYLTRQIPLDMTYPALLAATLISALLWIENRPKDNRLAKLGIVTSIGAALCDYTENFGVIAMIVSWPELSHQIVVGTSALTIAKSILTTAAALLVIGVGLTALMQLRKPPVPASKVAS